MQIDVRQATIDDLEGIAVLFDQYRIFYGQATDLESAYAFLFDRFEHNESVIFVAEEKAQNKLVGFTQLYPVFSSVSMKRVWLLNDLFVDEVYRKGGVANRLLTAAKDFAVKTKAKGIALSTAVNNKQAQSLYEKMGYAKDDAFYHYFLRV